MAYSETIKLVKGDTLPELTITLKDSNTAASGQTLDQEDPSTFAPIDITGGTVRVRIRQIGSTTILKTIVATITDASAGKVSMLFPADTLEDAGFFEAEVEYTTSGGNIQTVNDLIKLSVRDDFD
jgi:hypothetical protein